MTMDSMALPDLLRYLGYARAVRDLKNEDGRDCECVVGKRGDAVKCKSCVPAEQLRNLAKLP